MIRILIVQTLAALQTAVKIVLRLLKLVLFKARVVRRN
jgi:hypothetical protein